MTTNLPPRYQTGRAPARGNRRTTDGKPSALCDSLVLDCRAGRPLAWLSNNRPPEGTEGTVIWKPIEIEFKVEGSDLERLVLVGGDLEYLSDLPRDRLLTHTEIRPAAGVLRRLLVDNELGRVWRSISQNKARLTLEATCIDEALNAWPEQWIRYAWAGGANVTAGGAHHTGFVLTSVPKEEPSRYPSMEAFLADNPLPLEGQKRGMRLQDWLNSTSVAILTNEMGLVRISRSSVVRYIANRKGGVHFDPSRELTVGEGKKRRRRVLENLLDHGLLRIGHLSGPEFEVFSMIQVLTSAPRVMEIVCVAQDIAAEDFSGDPLDMKFWTGLREADGTGWATSRFDAHRTLFER